MKKLGLFFLILASCYLPLENGEGRRLESEAGGAAPLVPGGEVELPPGGDQCGWYRREGVEIPVECHRYDFGTHPVENYILPVDVSEVELDPLVGPESRLR